MNSETQKKTMDVNELIERGKSKGYSGPMRKCSRSWR